MMEKTIYNILAISIVILSINPNVDLYAQRTKSSLSAGEQRYAEKGLKDNRRFFYFINSSVSNFGSNEEKTIFKEAIQRDLIAQLLYMKFLFHESFIEIRRSQKLLINTYKKILMKDLKTTKKLLNNFAREVIKSDKYKARHYLKLGYRDVAHSKMHMLMADNYHPKLFSLRLYKYIRAIKKAKHGKRYAFLSIIESRPPYFDVNKIHKSILKINNEIKNLEDISNKLEISRSEKRDMRIKIKKKKFELYDKRIEYKKAKREIGRLNFEELSKVIISISEQQKDYYNTIHYDNYYKTKSGKSYFDQIWEDPRLNEIPEYKEYLKRD